MPLLVKNAEFFQVVVAVSSKNPESWVTHIKGQHKQKVDARKKGSVCAIPLQHLQSDLVREGCANEQRSNSSRCN